MNFFWSLTSESKSCVLVLKPDEWPHPKRLQWAPPLWMTWSWRSKRNLLGSQRRQHHGPQRSDYRLGQLKAKRYDHSLKFLQFSIKLRKTNSCVMSARNEREWSYLSTGTWRSPHVSRRHARETLLGLCTWNHRRGSCSWGTLWGRAPTIGWEGGLGPHPLLASSDVSSWAEGDTRRQDRHPNLYL